MRRDWIPGWEPMRDSTYREESLKKQTHITLLVLRRSSHTGTSTCNGNHKDITMSRIIPSFWRWTPDKGELPNGEQGACSPQSRPSSTELLLEALLMLKIKIQQIVDEVLSPMSSWRVHGHREGKGGYLG